MIIPLETNNNFRVCMGGGPILFQGISFTLLIPKETYSTCDFPRGVHEALDHKKTCSVQEL